MIRRREEAVLDFTGLCCIAIKRLDHSRNLGMVNGCILEGWRGLCIPKIGTAFDAALHDTQIRIVVGVCLTGCPC